MLTNLFLYKFIFFYFTTGLLSKNKSFIFSFSISSGIYFILLFPKSNKYKFFNLPNSLGNIVIWLFCNFNTFKFFILPISFGISTILPKDIIVDNVRMRSDIELLIDSLIHDYKFGRIDVAKFSFRYLFKLQKNNKFDSNNFIKTMLKHGFL